MRRISRMFERANTYETSYTAVLKIARWGRQNKPADAIWKCANVFYCSIQKAQFRRKIVHPLRNFQLRHEKQTFASKQRAHTTTSNSTPCKSQQLNWKKKNRWLALRENDGVPNVIKHWFVSTKFCPSNATCACKLCPELVSLRIKPMDSWSDVGTTNRITDFDGKNSASTSSDGIVSAG